MKQYLDFMRHVRENGTYKQDRTGTGAYSVFGHQMRFDLSEGFPALTTKKLHLKSIIHELLWFISGDTNTRCLEENGVTIWREWADENGDLGPVYGAQWRSWPTRDGRYIDQLKNVIEQIKTNADSRRLIVSAWNVGELENMALPPCHAFFQFYVAPMDLSERLLLDKDKYKKGDFSSDACDARGWTESDWWEKDRIHEYLDSVGVPRSKLSCQLYQRSADIFLGLGFNIASYALLTMMIAQICDLEPGEFIWSGGDCHLYSNHLEQADLQLTREPLPLPTLKLDPSIKNIDDFRFEHITLENYQHHAAISAPVAV